MKAVSLGATVLGIVVPVLSVMGIERIALEVLISMTLAATLSTAILVMILSSFSNKYK